MSSIEEIEEPFALGNQKENCKGKLKCVSDQRSFSTYFTLKNAIPGSQQCVYLELSFYPIYLRHCSQESAPGLQRFDCCDCHACVRLISNISISSFINIFNTDKYKYSVHCRSLSVYNCLSYNWLCGALRAHPGLWRDKV